MRFSRLLPISLEGCLQLNPADLPKLLQTVPQSSAEVAIPLQPRPPWSPSEAV